MLRVLMVLEDYGELMFLQTVLKKIGFDVDAIQNPRVFNDSVLRMNPDVLIMTAYGKRVNGVEMQKTVKRVRGLPHVIMIHAPGQGKDDDSLISGWLESPVGAVTLLHLLGDLCGLNKELLSDKFHKLRLQEDATPESRVLNISDASEAELERSKENHGNFQSDDGKKLVAETTMSADERSERFKKFTAVKPEHIGYAVKKVQEHIKTLRKLENPEDSADLERERKAFVEQLFNKKKSS